MLAPTWTPAGAGEPAWIGAAGQTTWCGSAGVAMDAVGDDPKTFGKQAWYPSITVSEISIPSRVVDLIVREIQDRYNPKRIHPRSPVTTLVYSFYFVFSLPLGR